MKKCKQFQLVTKSTRKIKDKWDMKKEKNSRIIMVLCFSRLLLRLVKKYRKCLKQWERKQCKKQKQNKLILTHNQYIYSYFSPMELEEERKLVIRCPPPITIKKQLHYKVNKHKKRTVDVVQNHDYS